MEFSWIVVAVFLLSIAGVVLWSIVSRTQRQRRMGATLLDLGRWTNGRWIVISSLLVGGGYVTSFGRMIAGNATVIDTGFSLLYCCWLIGTLVAWHRGTIVRERGLVSPVESVFWKQVIGYAWQGEHDRSLTVWTAPTRFIAAPHFELRIPSRHCAALDAVLQERLPDKRRAGKPPYQLDANGERILGWSGRTEPYPRTLPVGEAFYQPRTWNPFWWALYLCGALIMFPVWCVQALADWWRGRTAR